jgi:hypothetical protein
MNTTFLLLAEFGQTDIPLELVAAKYLGLDERAARFRAKRNELPFPAFRAGSQKSPWLVRITDLSAWLERERDQAEKEWKARKIAQVTQVAKVA